MNKIEKFFLGIFLLYLIVDILAAIVTMVDKHKGNYVCILKEQKGWVYADNAEDCGEIKTMLDNI